MALSILHQTHWVAPLLILSSSPVVVHNVRASTSSKLKNHYEVLGIMQDATHQQIKSAYFYKCKELHPDTNGGVASKEAFYELKQAYDTLRRPMDRRRYDHWLLHPDLNARWNNDNKEFVNRWRQGQDKAEDDFVWHIKSVFMFGVGFIFFIHIAEWYLLREERKRLEKLVDRDEIANSFMRQREIKKSTPDQWEQHERLGRLLRADIEEAMKRRMEDPEFRNWRNPLEIREKSRWMEATKESSNARTRNRPEK